MAALAVLAETSRRLRARRVDVLSLLGRRLLAAVILGLAVSLALFVLGQFSPFDPLNYLFGSRYQRIAEADRAGLRSALGFDQPWFAGWANWISHAITGDLGWSRVYESPVVEVWARRLPWTLLLSGIGLLIAVLIAGGLTHLTALRPASWLARACHGLAAIAQGVPSFLWGMGFIAFFAIGTRWLPSGGAWAPGGQITAGGVALRVLMPAAVVALSQVPWLVMSMQVACWQTLNSQPVQAAAERGLNPTTVRRGHILPMVLPVGVVQVGSRLPELIAGTVIAEELFAWPGIAGALVAAAKALDFPLLVSLSVVMTLVAVAAMALADVVQMLIDPRIEAES